MVEQLSVHPGETRTQQWLAAAEAIHVAMLVSFMCGYFLSTKK